MTVDTERAERLRAAVEAMPPGPSRARFAELAESLGRVGPRSQGPSEEPPRLGWSAATVDAPAFDPFAGSQFAAPTQPSPRRLLPLDDEVLPDEDVLPAVDTSDDEVPIGQWQTWAPPATRRPADDAPEDDVPEDDDDADADEPELLASDEEPGAGEQRAPLRIPADRPSPANEPVPPPKRQRGWRRRRSP
ncbi:MAG: hypothetical protein ACRDTP_02255 [Mycobacteriales bacterium]